jgi:hypothetical protein
MKADDVALKNIHVCPTCGRSGFTRHGYYIHWATSHKAASIDKRRPPYKLDAWPRAEKCISATRG